MRKPPATTLAWLAALIDGEGWVGYVKRKHKFTTYNYRAVLAVSNTERRLLEAIIEKTGTGRIYQHNRPPHENHKRVAYTWRLNATELRVWLPWLIPWLVLKKEQAQLLLAGLEIQATLTPRLGVSSSDPAYQEARNRRVEIAAGIKYLNRKGPREEQSPREGVM